MATKTLHRFIFITHRLRSKTVVSPVRQNDLLLIRFAQHQPQSSSETSSKSPSKNSSQPTSSATPSQLPPSTPPISTLNSSVLTSSIPLPPKTPSSDTVLPKNNEVSHPKSLKASLVSRYVQYVNYYIKFLDKKFPSAMNVSRIYMLGAKEFYRDLIQYTKLVVKVMGTPQAFRQLSRKDLELYQSMPGDIIRLTPFLLTSPLPLASSLIFPLAYKFPRQLLTSHFWSLQQRVEFALQKQRKRLRNQKVVLRGLQLQLESKVVRRDPVLHEKWSRVLAHLGSGGHPRPEEVLDCLPLFRGDPYHLDYLYPTHVNALCRLHGMHALWRRRKRLADHASIVHEIDLAIIREGGVECMSQDELRTACFLRGLNPVNMRNEELCLWLSHWVKISAEIDQSSLSLLLHCPVLFAYNKPSNWVLFH